MAYDESNFDAMVTYDMYKQYLIEIPNTILEDRDFLPKLISDNIGTYPVEIFFNGMIQAIYNQDSRFFGPILKLYMYI